jgi:hypothetical protein
MTKMVKMVMVTSEKCYFDDTIVCYMIELTMLVMS